MCECVRVAAFLASRMQKKSRLSDHTQALLWWSRWPHLIIGINSFLRHIPSFATYCITSSSTSDVGNWEDIMYIVESSSSWQKTKELKNDDDYQENGCTNCLLLLLFDSTSTYTTQTTTIILNSGVRFVNIINITAYIRSLLRYLGVVIFWIPCSTNAMLYKCIIAVYVSSINLTILIY